MVHAMNYDNSYYRQLSAIVVLLINDPSYCDGLGLENVDILNIMRDVRLFGKKYASSYNVSEYIDYYYNDKMAAPIPHEIKQAFMIHSSSQQPQSSQQQQQPRDPKNNQNNNDDKKMDEDEDKDEDEKNMDEDKCKDILEEVTDMHVFDHTDQHGKFIVHRNIDDDGYFYKTVINQYNNSKVDKTLHPTYFIIPSTEHLHLNKQVKLTEDDNACFIVIKSPSELNLKSWKQHVRKQFIFAKTKMIQDAAYIIIRGPKNDEFNANPEQFTDSEHRKIWHKLYPKKSMIHKSFINEQLKIHFVLNKGAGTVSILEYPDTLDDKFKVWRHAPNPVELVLAPNCRNNNLKEQQSIVVNNVNYIILYIVYISYFCCIYIVII